MQSTVMKTTKRVNGDHLVACPVDQYKVQFDAKIKNLKDLIKWDGNIDAFESPKSHFRMRANFQLWHDDGKNKNPEGLHYVMFDQDNESNRCEVKNFPRGTKKINQLMDELMIAVKESPEIFNGLFEVRFLTTQTEDTAVTLCYKRKIDGKWKVEAEKMATKLNIKIIGRSRNVKIVIGDENVIEKLKIFGKEFRYYQTEGAFSQPNAAVCEKMIEWAMNCTKDCQNKDLLELYCGGGTFTAPLAQNFKRVLATEISKASVDLALQTFKLNNITNIQIARLSSEEFNEAYHHKRKFQRLDDAKINVHSYNLSTVLVDPPRAGLDVETCKTIAQFNNIIYISCNPVTLARDLELLLKTHNMVRVAAFDQFPYTHHLEGGVYLTKKEDLNNNNDNNNTSNENNIDNSGSNDNNVKDTSNHNDADDNNARKKSKVDESK